MHKTLRVYLAGSYIGDLIEKNGQRLRFVYDKDAKADISLIMPRTQEVYYHKETFAFFENLLPEGDVLKLIAKSKGVSQNNPFSLLRVIGDDCAGAIHLHENEPNIGPQLPTAISDVDFNNIINDTSGARSLYHKDMRLSLAGAQDKTTIIMQDDKFYAPNFFYPSTHIIKFDNPHFTDVLYNELFCTTLAERLGLPVSKMELISKTKLPYLLIERFDRIQDNERIIRVHQEDFCQLLTVSSKNKYQNEGGPSFHNIVMTIDKLSTQRADTLMIAKILVFNVLIGNCDYHAKNLAILHSTKALTPFYDLVSTIIYEQLTTNMAMAINKKYALLDIRKTDIIAELGKWGMHGGRTLNLIINEFKHIVQYARELSKEATFVEKQPTISKIINFIEGQLNKLQ